MIASRLRSAPVTAILLGLLILVHAASGQTLNRKGKPFPSVNLPQIEHGPDIESALGGQFPNVADWYGQTATELRKWVKQDKDLRIDRRGRLHYACNAPLPVNGSSSTWGVTGKTFTAPFPDSQTFLLHSRPGAKKTIYLDFNGHTTSGTNWNVAYRGGADIVTPPYDIDGDPASSSPQELANIQVIWQSVAEDYAPFEVDVTTEDPGPEALSKTSPDDEYYGIRVCIGGSYADWYPAAVGGVAYYNSFDWDSDTPAFVFSTDLGAGNPKFVAEAAAHESGHTFGLHHDGLTNGTQYYQGQGNWAPIMGASYYVDITQWCKGEYSNANNTEDQLALINGYLPYRADTVGGDIDHATFVPGSSFSSGGLTETTGDVDVYSFVTGTGNVSLTAKASPPSSGNLNLLFSLYDAAGTAITTAGPSAADTGVTITTHLAAGTYFLAINGVGSGDPLLTGFSNYDCLGQYSLVGSVVPPNNQAPTAVAASSAPLTGMAPLAVSFSSAGSSDPDGTIASYSWNFGDGATSTQANPSHTYTNAGSYTASLTVEDNYGVASTPANVTVKADAPPVNQAPVAVASNSAPLSGPAPLTVNFSSAGSIDPDGSIASYSWNFGDGTTSPLANPSHTYSVIGNYTAVLTVTDNKGLASAPAVVTVMAKANQAPVAVASNSGPLTGAMPLTVNFSSAGSIDPDGSIASYKWTFGDGTTSTLANPSHTYTKIGTFVASLTVTDNRGLVSTPASVTITPKANQAPVAVASSSAPLTGYLPLAVSFSSAGSRDNDGSIASYKWTFGDNTTSTLANPSHTYSKAGSFKATLVVTDNLGLASASTFVTVTVKNPAVYVAALTITTTKNSSGSFATASITVTDQNGAVKSGATVKGTWSGLTTGNTSVVTNTSGVATTNSATTSKIGTFTYTVTGIALSGSTYDSTKNVQTKISIASP